MTDRKNDPMTYTDDPNETYVQRMARVLVAGCKRHDDMTEEKYQCEGREYTTLQIVLGALECASDVTIDDYDDAPVTELYEAIRNITK